MRESEKNKVVFLKDQKVLGILGNGWYFIQGGGFKYGDKLLEEKDMDRFVF